MLSTKGDVREVNRVHQKVAKSGARCNLFRWGNKAAVHLWSGNVTKDLEFLGFISPSGHQAALHHFPPSIKGSSCYVLPRSFLFFTDSSITRLGDVINALHASQSVSSSTSCNSALQSESFIFLPNAFNFLALVNARARVLVRGPPGSWATDSLFIPGRGD